MRLKHITQILERFVFGFTLTRHINLDALSHEP
jgi:hypothetical protein